MIGGYNQALLELFKKKIFFYINMEEEEEDKLKKKIIKIKKTIINLSHDNLYLEVRNNELWSTYLDRIVKVKKPNNINESLLFILIITEKFNLTNEEKDKALVKLGFNKRS